VFAIITQAPVHWQVVFFPLGILLQALLLMGLGLIVAPLVVFFRDLERAVKLILRFLFYASPIIYSLSDAPSGLAPIMAFNPLAGVFSLYRAAFFPGELDWYAVIVGTAVTLVLLAIGIVVFKRTERAVLKEI
jgi:ABC-2 type transport system permease protein